MATPDVRDFCQQLKAHLGLALWRGNDTDFAAVGDEDGLFIVSANGRPWNGNESPAQPLPTKIVLRGDHPTEVRFGGLPYQIFVKAAIR